MISKSLLSMNKKILYELLDHCELRRLNIIKLLIEHNKIVPFQKFTTHFSVSTPTLSNDIGVLNSVLNKYIFIEMNCYSTIRLSIEDKYIQEIEDMYLKESKCLQILNEILANTCNTINLTNLFHISQSSCYSYIRKIKLVLKNYNLDLTRKDLSIIGEEYKIRELHYLIYSIFNKEKLDQEFENMFYTLESNGFKISPAHKISIQNFLKLLIIRNYKSKYIQIEENIKVNILNIKAYQIFSCWLCELFNSRGISIDENELIYSFLFITKNFGYSLKNNDYTTYNGERFSTNVDEFIKDLDRLFNLCILENEYYHKSINEYFMSRFISMKYIPIKYSLYDAYDNNLEQIKTFVDNINLSDSYLPIKILIKRWYCKHNFRYILLKDVEDLIILITSFKLCNNKKSGKVLVYISRGKEWEKYIDVNIRKVLDKNVLIDLYSEVEFDNKYINEFDYNLIITDTVLKEINHENIMYINNTSIFGSIEDLKNKLSKIKL